ncbi:hypothetical protein [Nibribacter koreensis]|uniref:DUF4468 domain-containing protein n=1 Tax=Nibribacter koreensis TaxID=1084519 RepID=A0ABP8FA17_9BACT
MKRLSFLFLFISLLVTKAYSQKTEDYIITTAGDTIAGKVIYAPGTKIQFKAAGQKKVKEYFPLEIHGYWYKGSYKISKFSKTDNKAVYAYHYRPNEDSVAFEKATGLTVPQNGKIVLYYNKPRRSATFMSSTGAMMGGGQTTASVIYEVKGTDELYFSTVYSSGLLLWDKSEAIQILAEIVKPYPELAQRVKSMQGKFTIEIVSQIVKEYNAWYVSQSAKS